MPSDLTSGLGTNKAYRSVYFPYRSSVTQEESFNLPQDSELNGESGSFQAFLGELYYQKFDLEKNIRNFQLKIENSDYTAELLSESR